MRNVYKILAQNFEGKWQVTEELDVAGMIILKLAVMKLDMWGCG